MNLNFFKKIKSERIKDAYFGEMTVEYDNESKKYYLEKNIDLDKIPTQITLCIESSQKHSSINQQKLYEKIIETFESSWNTVIKWLSEKEKFVTQAKLNTEYRIESVTIPNSVNPKEYLWELDLIYLIGGFSRIIIEMKTNEPINYSVQA